MAYNNISWIHDWLQDWAADWARRNGFSSTTILYRQMMTGQVTESNFHSMVPKGAEDSSQGHVRRLQFCMGELREAGKGKEIDAVQYHYLIGPKKGAAMMGYTSRHFRRLRKEGARLLALQVEAMRK